MSIQETKTVILEEIKRILVADKNKETDCIDLWSLEQLMKKEYDEQISAITQLKKLIDSSLSERYDEPLSSEFKFSYEPDVSSLEMTVLFGNQFVERIDFNVLKDDIIIRQTCTRCNIGGKELPSHAIEYFSLLGPNLLELSNIYISKREKICDDYKINPVNSSFSVVIGTKKARIAFENDFELEFDNFKNEFKCDCKSYRVLEAIEGFEAPIFRRIFVKIEDCPEWMRPALYEIRQSQLTGEQPTQKETGKQKVKDFIRKIFGL